MFSSLFYLSKRHFFLGHLVYFGVTDHSTFEAKLFNFNFYKNLQKNFQFQFENPYIIPNFLPKFCLMMITILQVSLLGGKSVQENYGPPSTSELLTENGQSDLSFDLQYKT